MDWMFVFLVDKLNSLFIVDSETELSKYYNCSGTNEVCTDSCIAHVYWVYRCECVLTVHEFNKIGAVHSTCFIITRVIALFSYADDMDVWLIDYNCWR